MRHSDGGCLPRCAPVTGPRITVVVVTWNGAELVDDCLGALFAQTLPQSAYEVWVVDNASGDGTADTVARHWPYARLLQNNTNLGFAGGCNTALRLVATDYAVLVNSDAVAAPDFLAHLLARADSTPAAGAISAKVLLLPHFVVTTETAPPALVVADGRHVLPLARPIDAAAVDEDSVEIVDVLNSTGNQLRSDGAAEDRDWLRVDVGRDSPQTVFGVCGAAALLRMSALREVGVFTDEFFLYYEDTELSWRLRLLGWEIVYEARASVRHAHAASTGEGSPVHRFYDERNRLLTLATCAPGAVALRIIGRHLLTVASGIRREGPPWSRTRQRLRALASFSALLPGALRRRRRLSRHARVDRRTVFALAVPARPNRGYRPSAD